MDGSDLVSAVRSDAATYLDRLGSEKALVATTDATLERDAVLAAAAASERRAVDTFRAWAETEEDETARAAFASVAATESDHLERVRDLQQSESAEDTTPDALHEHLRGLSGTPERVGAGLVGRPMASERTLLQVVNFFVNEADQSTAALFRELRTETQTMTDRGAAVLEDVCTTDDEWTRSQEAAVTAIEVAYEEYADRLESMGLDPAPVC